MRNHFRAFVTLCILCGPGFFSRASADELDLYSLHTASFVYHPYGSDKKFTQYFKNEFIAIERRMDQDSDYSLSLGTLKNSEGNRCMLFALGKKWGEYKKWSFEGLYAYTGEFFFDTFSHCGDSGAYHDLKKATGIGFAPYIYHGVKYDVNDYIGLRSGFILPGIIVLSVQLRFK
ncbi:hypothetical protein [[Erwinia] mediterraneensis]|uniref:hypothetical protein n=1 Tax=[Erwinia] mediterraneensis TaxID=2161819 RepID=UPI001F3DF74C|nr:hypothetical protein [[Erwinia] mediterraneensis]